MQADGQVLTEVLGNARLEVPPWQRRYSWDPDNWLTMWETLDDVRKAAAGSQHFMGALVFQRENRQTGMTVRARIIDGQQRLATLSVILVGVRQRLSGYPETEPRKQRIAQLEALLMNAGTDTRRRLKVVPYGDDLEAYLACLRGAPDPDSQIGRAFLYFIDRLKDLREPSLIRLRDRIASSLYFAAVTLEDSDDAHKIFKSLNEAGMTLDPTDHIRNNLFMSAGSIADELYTRHWQTLEGLMPKREELLSFLFAEQARRAHESNSLRRKELHRAYAKRFSHESRSKAQITRFVSRLEDDGRVFAALHKPDDLAAAGIPRANAIRPSVARLAEWGSQPSFIWILDVLVRYRDGDISLAQAKTSLSTIEGFLVRRFLGGEKANLLSRIFTDLVNQIPEGGRYPARLRTALSFPGHAWPTDTELENSVTTVLSFYTQGSAAQRRFILKQLNGHKLVAGKLKKDQFELDWSQDLTIEHIMPVALTDHWRRELERERKARGLTQSIEDLHASHLNLLGNLTLAPLGSNARYSNKPFSEKVALINEELPIRLNKQLGRAPYQTWSLEVISNRSTELAKLASAIWLGPE